MSENVITLTDETFSHTIESAQLPILVDFWAPWCGPCKIVAPVLQEISEEKKDSLVIAKVDVDQNPNVASQFQIMSIPTMILFKNGEVIKTIMGAKTKKNLLTELDTLIS